MGIRVSEKRALIISAQSIAAISSITAPGGAKGGLPDQDLQNEQTGLATGLGFTIRSASEEALQFT